MFVVLIETSGNQNYIFATNKLKENIGASELTYQVGTKWTISAIATIDGQNRLLDLWIENNSEELRQKLLDPKLNPPLKQSGYKVEIILAASGKALLLTKDKETAQKIISEVTLKAIEDAPGIDVSGVIHEFYLSEENNQSIINAIKDIHQTHERNRYLIPSPTMRFLRLPVVEECAYSGLPAAGVEEYEGGKAISASSQAKRNFKTRGFNRINSLLQTKYPKCDFSKSIDRLDSSFFQEEKTKDSKQNSQIEWLGLIHADGNGLGQIFINFGKHLGKIKPNFSNRDYINELRNFSLALDSCTEKAFLSALKIFKPDEKSLPIFPLVLGGDDLTIVCDGKLALPFTKKFLEEFESETSKNETISTIAKVALKDSRLSACAGIAIIKPHFPFSVAYDLAEALAKSAKIVKNKVHQIGDSEKIPYPCSAIDFQVVYDSSGIELNRIRTKLVVDGGKTQLYRRPYVVTPKEKLKEASGKDWLKIHSWNSLQNQVNALKEKDKEGKPKLPNSQIYQLRESLFLGQEIADHRYQLIKHRYIEQGIEKLEGDRDSLFVKEKDDSHDLNKEIEVTGLLDAIEIANFLDSEA